MKIPDEDEKDDEEDLDTVRKETIATAFMKKVKSAYKSTTH